MTRRNEPDAGIWRLNPEHACWPGLWRQMDDAPLLLSGTGRRECLQGDILAIVGTRKATARGVAIAHRLAGELAGAGWTIVSGLARGIDSAAHRGALEAGGPTIAVLASGIDRTYPSENASLRREIEKNGCVISEEADGTPPLRYNFPKRNRLVAGMAAGVIVLHPPLPLSALLTAMQAADYGRDVFAVPGPIDRREAAGCHHLIKQGAILLESVADVHQVLPPPLSDAAKQATRLPASGTVARWIWDRLDLTGLRLSELQRIWAGTPQVFAEGLMALEMAGLIHRLPGGVVARRIWVADADETG